MNTHIEGYLTMLTVQTVCLAISRKYQNYCVARYDIIHKRMIRLFIDDENRYIHPSHCLPDNLCMPKVLDVIEIPILKHCHLKCPSENYFIDTSKRWKYLYSFDKTKLDEFVDSP